MKEYTVYLTKSGLFGDLPPNSTRLQIWQLQFILVANVGETRMRLFPNYFFRNQNTADTQGGCPATTFNDHLENDTGLMK